MISSRINSIRVNLREISRVKREISLLIFELLSLKDIKIALSYRNSIKNQININSN